MTRGEAIEFLKSEYNTLDQRALSDGFILVEVGPLPIIGGTQETKVALKLPEQIDTVPEVFVETNITLNSGGQPANTTNVDIEGKSWKKWSFKTPWNPQNYTIVQLINAALSIFNR